MPCNPVTLCRDLRTQKRISMSHGPEGTISWVISAPQQPEERGLRFG
jgi:hypothetical protein